MNKTIENKLNEVSEIASLDLPCKYKPIRKLGEGYVSRVYEVYDTIYEKNIAVKVISADQENIKEKAYMYFGKLQDISNPNLLKVYSVVRHNNKLIIEMELFDTTLRHMLNECKDGLSLPDALTFFQQIVDCLDMCYGEKIIHQDLTPNNIGIKNECTTKLGYQICCVKLTDFNASLYKSNGKLKFGPLDYSSPSILNSSRTNAIVKREDNYWSLGVILYEMLTGKKIFSPNEHSTKQEVQQLQNQFLELNDSGRKKFISEKVNAINIIPFDVMLWDFYNLQGLLLVPNRH